MSTALTIRLATTSVLLLASLPAQMSGTYALDPNGTGSRNFKTFNAAAMQLSLSGVAGPVVFEVVAGTYAERVITQFIAGASATNPIVFRSRTRGAARVDVANGYFWQSGSNASGPSRGLVFDGFTFFTTNKENSAPVFYLAGEDHVIRDCTFEKCYVRCSGTLDVHHNRFLGTPEYKAYNAIVYSIAKGGAFHHNFIELDEVYTAFEIRASTSHGVRTRVYDNVIFGSLYSSTSDAAVEIQANVEFTHNTVVVTKLRSFAVCRVLTVDARNTPGAVVRNNIVVNLNGGYLAWVEGANASAYDVSSNIYWAPGSSYAFRDARTNTVLPALALWQNATGYDADSLVADPELQNTVAAALDLRLKDSSPAIGMARKTPTYVTTDFADARRYDPASVGAYEGTPRASFTVWGKGCPGLLGNVPKIDSSGSRSFGSTNFAVELSNALGNNQLAALALGASNTSWGTIPLPLHVGATCNLLVAPHILVLLPVSGTGVGNGSASIKLPIPNAWSLKGAVLHLQWGIGDAAAKGIGVAFSDAATLRL